MIRFLRTACKSDCALRRKEKPAHILRKELDGNVKEMGLGTD